MYITEKVDYSVKDFISKYQPKFPLLAVITQGYLGNFESETFDTGQILRLHVVDRITDDHHGQIKGIKTLSFPINHESEILVSTTKGKLKTIEDIARKGKLPCKINVSEVYNVHQTDNVLRLDQSVSIILEELHELQCILGNPVHEVELLNHVIAIPEYLQHVRLAIVMGIEGFDQSNWVQLQNYMSDVVDNYICFQKFSAVKEIITFSDDITKTNGICNNESFQFSTLVRDSENNNYGIVQCRNSSRVKDEPVYAIIPDHKNQRLTIQSAEWKRKLNILSQEKVIKNSNPRSDNPPPLPPRKTISVKEEPPKLLPKSLKMKTLKTKIASTGLMLDTTMVQPRVTDPNRAGYSSKEMLENIHPKNDCLLEGMKSERDYVLKEAKTKIDCLMEDIKTERECSAEKKRTEIGNSLEDMKTGRGCSLQNMKTESGWSLKEKTIADIGETLRQLNLHKYVDIFAKSLIDGAILKECNMDVLFEFGFKQVEAIRLLKYIKCGHVPK